MQWRDGAFFFVRAATVLFFVVAFWRLSVLRVVGSLHRLRLLSCAMSIHICFLLVVFACLLWTICFVWRLSIFFENVLFFPWFFRFFVLVVSGRQKTQKKSAQTLKFFENVRSVRLNTKEKEPDLHRVYYSKKSPDDTSEGTQGRDRRSNCGFHGFFYFF